MSVNDQLGVAGKVVIILGGGQGNGEATAIRFARAGCNVAIVDLDVTKADKVARDVRGHGVRAITLTADVRQPDECRRIMDETSAQLGVPDYMVAIIGQANMKSILDLTPEELDHDLSINFRYLFFASQAFARALIAAKKPGAISAISSVDGIMGSPIHAAYGAAKAAVINFVKSAAIEWADHGIRVNCVAPGSIVTVRVPDSDERRKVMHDSMVPLRRSGQPEEIAGAMLFLCSDLSSYMTGHTLNVDGGWTIGNYFNAAYRAEGMILDNGDKF
jgi:NAD(P)-dependent dehydrogenase (short-subunit alcohol dehydrogenase family)